MRKPRPKGRAGKTPSRMRNDREQLRIMLGHTNYDYVDLYSHPDDVVMARNVLAAVRRALRRG